MAKDKRYNTLKKLIDSSCITNFSELLDVIPKTVIARDLSIHHKTFNSLLNNLDRFMLKDIYRIASLIEVDKWEVLKLFVNESLTAKKTKRKKKELKTDFGSNHIRSVQQCGKTFR